MEKHFVTTEELKQVFPNGNCVFVNTEYNKTNPIFISKRKKLKK